MAVCWRLQASLPRRTLLSPRSRRAGGTARDALAAQIDVTARSLGVVTFPEACAGPRAGSRPSGISPARQREGPGSALTRAVRGRTSPGVPCAHETRSSLRGRRHGAVSARKPAAGSLCRRGRVPRCENVRSLTGRTGLPAFTPAINEVSIHAARSSRETAHEARSCRCRLPLRTGVRGLLHRRAQSLPSSVGSSSNMSSPPIPSTNPCTTSSSRTGRSSACRSWWRGCAGQARCGSS